MLGFPIKFLVGTITWLSGVSWVISSEVSNIFSDDIVLGTYEDYMSPDMAQHIFSNYSIKQDYLKHDQVVKQNFKKGVYGMATVSTSIIEELISEDLVEKIDWNKLGLKSGSDDIQDSSKAKDLFSDVVKKVLEGNTKFLEYGFPYFVHNLGFCYKGSEISELKSSVKWDKLIETIAKDTRFKSISGKPQLGLIDDPRTVLSLARLVSGETDVNKKPEYSNYSEIYSDYSKLFNKGLSREKMGHNFLLMESISANLVDSLVAGDIQGAIIYNTDCLYATYGGNISDPELTKDLHFVELSETLILLDFLVINKSISEDKKTKIYKFYKDVLMDGYSDKNKILEKEEDEYKHWLTRNFDYVKYTPVVKNLIEKVEEQYFEDDSSKKDLRKKTIKVSYNGSDIKKNYESLLSEKTKSDMLIAFEKFKTQL